MQDKQILLVTGMHRSGTSAVAGLLCQHGFSAGKTLLEPWEDNAKGFFENQHILNINEHLLSHFKCSWDVPFLLPKDWHLDPALKVYEEELDGILNIEFDNESNILIKDPRLCVLFPWYQQYFNSRNIAFHCIIVIRHPLEIAASLNRRNGFGEKRSLLLWYFYMSQIEEKSRTANRLFVSYDDLIQNYKKASKQLFGWIAQNFSVDIIDNSDENWLSPALKHQHITNNIDPLDFNKLYQNYKKAVYSKRIFPTDSFDALYRSVNTILNFTLEPEVFVSFGERQFFQQSRIRIQLEEGGTHRYPPMMTIIDTRRKLQRLHFQMDNLVPISEFRWNPVLNAQCDLSVHSIKVYTSENELIHISPLSRINKRKKRE